MLSKQSAARTDECSVIYTRLVRVTATDFDYYLCYLCLNCVIIIHADVCDSVRSCSLFYFFSFVCVLCSYAQHVDGNSADPWCFLVGRGTTQRCMC